MKSVLRGTLREREKRPKHIRFEYEIATDKTIVFLLISLSGKKDSLPLSGKKDSLLLPGKKDSLLLSGNTDYLLLPGKKDSSSSSPS